MSLSGTTTLPCDNRGTRIDELDTEFTLFREVLLARKRSGQTQAEVTEKMGTKPPAVTRFETALGQSPFIHNRNVEEIRKQ